MSERYPLGSWKSPGGTQHPASSSPHYTPTAPPPASNTNSTIPMFQPHMLQSMFQRQGMAPLPSQSPTPVATRKEPFVGRTSVISAPNPLSKFDPSQFSGATFGFGAPKQAPLTPAVLQTRQIPQPAPPSHSTVPLRHNQSSNPQNIIPKPQIQAIPFQINYTTNPLTQPSWNNVQQSNIIQPGFNGTIPVPVNAEAAENENHKAEILSIKNELVAVREEFRVRMLDVDEKRKAIDDQVKQNKWSNDKIRELEALLSNAHAATKNEQSLVSELRDTIASLGMDFENQKSKIMDLEKQLMEKNELEAKLKDANDTLGNEQNTTSQLRGTISKLQTSAGDREAKIKGLEEKIAERCNLETKLKQANAAVSKERDKVAELDTTIAALNNELGGCRIEIKNLQTDFREQQKALAKSKSAEDTAKVGLKRANERYDHLYNNRAVRDIRRNNRTIGDILAEDNTVPPLPSRRGSRSSLNTPTPNASASNTSVVPTVLDNVPMPVEEVVPVEMSSITSKANDLSNCLVEFPSKAEPLISASVNNWDLETDDTGYLLFNDARISVDTLKTEQGYMFVDTWDNDDYFNKPSVLVVNGMKLPLYGEHALDDILEALDEEERSQPQAVITQFAVQPPIVYSPPTNKPALSLTFSCIIFEETIPNLAEIVQEQHAETSTDTAEPNEANGDPSKPPNTQAIAEVSPTTKIDGNYKLSIWDRIMFVVAALLIAIMGVASTLGLTPYLQHFMTSSWKLLFQELYTPVGKWFGIIPWTRRDILREYCPELTEEKINALVSRGRKSIIEIEAHRQHWTFYDMIKNWKKADKYDLITVLSLVVLLIFLPVITMAYHYERFITNSMNSVRMDLQPCNLALGQYDVPVPDVIVGEGNNTLTVVMPTQLHLRWSTSESAKYIDIIVIVEDILEEDTDILSEESSVNSDSEPDVSEPEGKKRVGLAIAGVFVLVAVAAVLVSDTWM